MGIVHFRGGVGVENNADKPSFHDETAKPAYKEAMAAQEPIPQSGRAIETRIIIVFLLASTASILIPVFAHPEASGWPLIFWISAIPFWVVTALYACVAFYRSSWFLGPDPKVISEKEWLKRPPVADRCSRLRAMGTSFEKNRCETNEKLDAFATIIICAAAEIALLVLAVLVSSY